VAKSRPDAPEQRSQTGIWTRAAPLTVEIITLVCAHKARIEEKHPAQHENLRESVYVRS
jgi:hypothetical protein